MTETYDPNNKDDIFAALQTRVDELKRKYSDIEREFSRKKKQIPVMCPICMDNFDSSQQVIQLTCNKNHIFHEPCLFQWYSKNKNCPLCRVKNTHALPENLNIQ
ncbi:hypothetical protein FGO68_gene16386 [Halteria grandinella]|uniref:RING-type domain-containing protein n=1 Tax=Halteria grandinella TaxID=5974 RepID=A0A8J8NKX4_HALGN|nr:hypothetical protein FGO68_gene16386 [Halteria grandinella]